MAALVALGASAQEATVRVSDDVLARVDDDAFGIQYHDRTYGDPLALQRLGVLPLSSVRLWAYPSEVHPAPGVWVWDGLDAAIAEVVAAGYTPWVCLFQAEEWYTGTPDAPWWTDASAHAEWRAVASALGERYGDVVGGWIVFDEVNLLRPEGPYYMSPDLSAALYLDAARALRAADPGARVGGPSGFSGWENGYWAARVLATDGGDALLDFVSSNLFLSWDADDSDDEIMDRTIWYEEAPLKIRSMVGDADVRLVLDAYNVSALWTRDGTPTGERWTDPRNVDTFGGVAQVAALLHAVRGGFDVMLRWETLGGYGILTWYPEFETRPPYDAWRLLAGPGRLGPGSELLQVSTTEPPLADLPHHSGQDVAGYAVQPFAVRDAAGVSVVLVNKYAEPRSVVVEAPIDAGHHEVYRFDAKRHASASTPLTGAGGEVRRGDPLALDLPGQSVTVVAFDTGAATALQADLDGRPHVVSVGPNPFAGDLRVRYALPASAGVTLDVWTPVGRHVARLASGTIPAGTHETRADLSALSRGAYLIRLCAAGECVTRTVGKVR